MNTLGEKSDVKPIYKRAATFTSLGAIVSGGCPTCKRTYQVIERSLKLAYCPSCVRHLVPLLRQLPLFSEAPKDDE